MAIYNNLVTFKSVRMLRNQVVLNRQKRKSMKRIKASVASIIKDVKGQDECLRHP